MTNLMQAPMHYLQTLRKIIYDRMEAQRLAKEAEEEAEKERQKNGVKSNKPPLPPGLVLSKVSGQQPTDVRPPANTNMSPIEADALEDAFEELTEGGIM